MLPLLDFWAVCGCEGGFSSFLSDSLIGLEFGTSRSCGFGYCTQISFVSLPPTPGWAYPVGPN